MNRFLRAFSYLFPRREIRNKGDLYMERWYLAGAMDATTAQKWNCGRIPRQRLGFLPTTYLHCIHRPDADPDCHNHPWWARALILSGGYLEERRMLLGSRLFDVAPGSVLRIEPTTFHRICELAQPQSWSVFVHGPKVQDWGFLTPGGRFVLATQRYADTNNG